jgi:calcium-independent phospholipase A2-gamma
LSFINSKLELDFYAVALLGHCKPLKTEYLRVLSVDGGGIRGIVVIELMRRLEELTNKKFFELFDFICGVSTGSILVCGMTAKPGRTLLEGKNIYKYVAKRVFEQSGTFDLLAATSRLMFQHAFYDVDLWNSLLREYISDTRIIDTSKHESVPKFCCVSTTLGEDAIEAHVFRNYGLPSNVESIYPGSHTAALWEVVRCSSAAPTYFGDYILNNQVHQDGGILYVSYPYLSHQKTSTFSLFM